jgi:hypothetical protein
MPKLQESVYLLSKNFDRFCYIERGEGYDLEAFSFDGVTQVRQTHQNKLLDLPALTFFISIRRNLATLTNLIV